MECEICGTTENVKIRDDGLPYCDKCWQDMLNEEEEEEEEEELGDEEDEDY